MDAQHPNDSAEEGSTLHERTLKPTLRAAERPPETRRRGLAGFLGLRKRLRKRVKALEARLLRMETRLENTNALAASLARDIERMHSGARIPSACATEPPPVAHAPESSSQLYCAFENEFRGDPAIISLRQSEYLPLILKASAACPGGKVLDVGCGRGEFLRLLRDNGIPAMGVDLDAAMAERCVAQGFDVEHGDFTSVLNQGEDGILAGVVAFQVVEHIGYENIVELIKSAHARTAPGGVIILETVNPASFTGLRDFYLDPTHRNPIPAPTIEFLVRACGYREVNVQYSSPIPPHRQLKGRGSNTAKLNALLFGPRDYAVTGWR